MILFVIYIYIYIVLEGANIPKFEWPGTGTLSLDLNKPREETVLIAGGKSFHKTGAAAEEKTLSPYDLKWNLSTLRFNWSPDLRVQLGSYASRSSVR